MNQVFQQNKDMLMAQLHLQVAKLYHLNKYYSQAIRNYQQATTLSLSTDQVYNKLGSALDESYDHQGAIQCYRKSITINPKYYPAYNNTGIALNKLGRNQQSIEFYQKAIHLNPNNFNAYNNMGCSYHDISQYQKAIYCYEKALGLNPNSPMILNNMGKSCVKLNKCQRAMICYRRALRVHLDYNNAYKNIASQLEKDSQKVIIANELIKAAQLGNRNYKKYLQIGSLFTQIKFWQQAQIILKEAILINPYHPEAYYQIAILYQAKNDINSALINYDKAIQLNPTNQTYYLQKKLIANNSNHHIPEIQSYNKLIKENPQSWEVYSNLAQYYQKQGKLLLSSIYYSKSIHLNRRNLITICKRALVYQRQNKEQDYQSGLTSIFQILNDGYIREINQATYRTLKKLIFQDQKNIKLIRNCILCQIRPKNCIFNECGHFYVCYQCFLQLPKPNKCPICRKNTKTRKIN